MNLSRRSLLPAVLGGAAAAVPAVVLARSSATPPNSVRPQPFDPAREVRHGAGFGRRSNLVTWVGRRDVPLGHETIENSRWCTDSRGDTHHGVDREVLPEACGSGRLIVDGSITGDKIVCGTISASQITAGTISVAKLNVA